MISALLRARQGAPLLRRVALGSRQASDEASDSDAGTKQREPPMVFSRTGGDKELRYFVLPPEQGHTSPALSMLESSARGTPMPGPPGRKPRMFKMPHPGVCNKVLTDSAQDLQLAARSAELAELLLQKGVPLEPHTLKALINGLGKAEELQAALPVVDAWLQQQEDALEDDVNTQAPLQVMTLLMDTATRAENTQMVLQVLARMARIGVTPAPQSLTTLLQCFMRLGQVNVAHNVLDWMRRNNLEPNVYSYTALLALPKHMNEAAAPELLDQARMAYEKMQADGVLPNARFYTEYIRICGRAGNMQAAAAAWQDAQEAGVQPDLILYSAMIDVCAKCRDPAAAMRVFMEMRRSSVQPDVVAYTCLLTALQATPQAAATARDLWRSMKQDGVRLNGMAIAAFLEILLLEGEIDEALQILAAARPGGGSSGGDGSSKAPSKTGWHRKAARMAESAGLEYALQQEPAPAELGVVDGEGSQVEAGVNLPRLYEHFLFTMAHKGQYTVVEQLARHMRSRGLPQTLGTASALLTSQALQHNHATAKWLLQPYAAASHAGGSNGGGGGSSATVQLPDEAVESCLLGRGSPEDCSQRLMQHSAAASGGGGGDRSSKAAEAAGAGFTSGAVIRPTTITANIVLAGLAVRGCTAEAVQLFDWMQRQRQRQQQHQKPDRKAAATAAPNWWTHQLLLFAALNAPKEQQLELAIRAVREAREYSAGGGGQKRSSGSWDRRTRNAIATVMRQSEQARSLLGAEVEGTAVEHEERMRQLKALMN